VHQRTNELLVEQQTFPDRLATAVNQRAKHTLNAAQKGEAIYMLSEFI
jgi:hypothetical protein